MFSITSTARTVIITTLGVQAARAVSDIGGSKEEIIFKWLRAVDLCEVFAPPWVGKESMKFAMDGRDAMDVKTWCDSNKQEDCRK